MKKTLLILLLSTAVFTVKAQNMSFDETLKYIKDKLWVAEVPEVLTAQKDGTIKYNFPNGVIHTLNLFDLCQEPIENKDYSKQDKGIVYSVTSDQMCIKLIINSKGDYENFAYLSNEKEEERVYNALIYLRSLCTKTKDPFDK